MFDSFSTPWTIDWQALLSIGFLRQEYWNGLPFPSPKDLFDLGIEPESSALTGGFFTTEPLGQPTFIVTYQKFLLALQLHRRDTLLYCSWYQCILTEVSVSIWLPHMFGSFQPHLLGSFWASLIALLVKNPLATQKTWVRSWVRKICWRRDRLPTPVFLAFPCGSAGKEYAHNARDHGFNPWIGKIP